MLLCKNLNFKTILTLLFAAVILSACGGGGASARSSVDDVSVGTDNDNDNNNDNNNNDNDNDGISDPNACGIAESRVNDMCTPDPIVAYQACNDNITGAVTFHTPEYYFSGDGGETDNAKAPLALICASAAYARIATISGAVAGGEGQTIGVLDSRFNTSHDEFKDGSERVFESVYDPLTDTTYTDTDDDGNGTVDLLDPPTANCRQDAADIDSSFPACDETHGTHVTGIIAAVKKPRLSSLNMHGVAYNAKIKAVNFVGHGLDTAQEVKAIKAGSGTDVVAMNNSWDEQITACAKYNNTNYYYHRPPGLSVLKDDCSTQSNYGIAAAKLAAWKEAVDNGTIIVFANGNEGMNSETGMVTVYTSKDDLDNDMNEEEISASDLFGEDDANIPGFYGSYPALYDDDDLQTGRWLTVVAVDEDAKIASFSNGCGVAMRICLAAPGVGIASAVGENADKYLWGGAGGTSQAAPHVSGALAVLKGAFPTITPDNLTKLVLETASYIPLADDDDEIEQRTKITITDGGTRYINTVYGYGLLNLNAATLPSVTSSYVTAANNESIGALWADTKLTLSSHFGDNFEPVTFGIGDVYGRHFVTNAPQTSYAPVAVSLDDYMANMLADNVQSEKLGTQAQANYSNNGNQSWMNLEYISGNATTKIAFQDGYKVNPLSDTGTTSILRANNIRPASSNIGMMDVDYKLGNALSLSSYLARGEYDTGYKFDELATDFDVNYKQSHLNIAIGNIREHGQFLGTNTSGAYALNAPSISRFTDVTYGHNLGKFNIYANYINYETDVNMLHDQFASIDGLQADQYQIGFTGKDLISKDDSLNVALITKLGVTDGALNQNTVLGYTADGAFNNASQSYDLAVSNRHQQFEITYQGKLYQNADKVSNFRDNRFFTSIRVDQNLNHIQGLGQTEIIGGINIRY